MEKTEEGRAVLVKYGKIKKLQESLSVLKKHLNSQNGNTTEEDNSTSSPGQNSVVANDANTAKNGGGGTASASEQLRTILQLRGVNIGDEEFEAMLETEQGKAMLLRVQQLQEEEDEVEFSDNASAKNNDNNDIEQDYNEDKAELTKKLQELQQLQKMLMSLGNRVEEATSIENEDGKVLSEEDAVGLRNEFEKLQTMMTFLQDEVDQVENDKVREGNQDLPAQQVQQQALPTLTEYDANSPRPKTSRRVPQPTPEEYTDYVPPSLRSAPPLNQTQPHYTVEQTVIHDDISGNTINESMKLGNGNNNNNNNNDLKSPTGRPKTSRRTPRPSPEAFMDYVSPSKKREQMNKNISGKDNTRPAYQVEVESFENNSIENLNVTPPPSNSRNRLMLDMSRIAENALDYLWSLDSNEERGIALQELFEEEAPFDVEEDDENNSAYSRLKMLSSILIMKMFDSRQMMNDDVRADDPNTENMQGHLNSIVGRSQGHKDFTLLLLRELNRAPLHDDAFRMKCLRFFAENVTMDGQFTNQGDYDEVDNNNEMSSNMMDRVLNAPIMHDRNGDSNTTMLTRVSPLDRRRSPQREQGNRIEKENELLARRLIEVPVTSPSKNKAMAGTVRNAKTPTRMTPPSKRFKGVGGGINNRKSTKSANFPKNMPFDYVENVRASMASSVGTDFDEGNINGGDFKIDLAAAQTVTTPGGRKHKNMPFDYVENVRASLASSIATDVEDDFDGKANPIRMNSYNLSSSAGGSDQLDDEDGDNDEEETSGDDGEDEDDNKFHSNGVLLHHRGEVDENWKRWGSESRNSDASWSFASDNGGENNNKTRISREASSVGMGSDDEDQMASSDGSVRGWDDNNQSNSNTTIVPGVKPHVPMNHDGSKLSKHELVLQSLQSRLPELLDGLGTGLMTRATLMRVCRNILRVVRNQPDNMYRSGKMAWNGPGTLSRTGPLLDPQLKKSIEKCFTKYEGLNAPTHKDELIQDISDILYDELVFHNIVRKLESSYAKDLKELEISGNFNDDTFSKLLENKEEDLRRLHEERRHRLAGENPVTVRHTRNNDALRETMISNTFDTDESISESGGDVLYENYSTNNMDGETDSMNDEESYNDNSDSDNVLKASGKSLTRQNRNDNLERSPQASNIAKRVLENSSSVEDLLDGGGNNINNNNNAVDQDGFLDIGTLPLPKETEGLKEFVDRSSNNINNNNNNSSDGEGNNTDAIEFPQNIDFNNDRMRDLQQRFEAEQQQQIINNVTNSISNRNVSSDAVLNPDEYLKQSGAGTGAGQKKQVVVAKKKKGKGRKKRRNKK